MAQHMLFVPGEPRQWVSTGQTLSVKNHWFKGLRVKLATSKMVAQRMLMLSLCALDIFIPTLILKTTFVCEVRTIFTPTICTKARSGWGQMEMATMLETIGSFILVSKDIIFSTVAITITDFDRKYNIIKLTNIREPRSILHVYDVWCASTLGC